MSADTDPGPLSGYKVVELGVWIAAPAAAGVLADWGADVVKIEPPTGDPQRHFHAALGIEAPRSPFFELDNRGKRSAALDLKTGDDRSLLDDLLADADVFVTNLRPQALDALGLDPAKIRARWPRLIYARITGFGAEGPDRDRASYDVGAFWSRSGLADRMTVRDQAPPILPPAVGDHLTAMNLVAGISAALADRERTGVGRLVETSLLRTGLYAGASDLSIQLLNGKMRSQPPRTKFGAPLQNCYPTSDGRWFWLLCLESDRHWPNLVRAMGSPTWADDDRFANAARRFEHRRELIAHFDEIFTTKTLDEWCAIFDAEGVWFAPVNTLGDVANDPQAHAAHAFVEIPECDARSALTSPASPVDFDGQAPAPRAACPDIGEHTDEIRRAGASREDS